MILRQPRSTRTYTLFPYTTRFRALIRVALEETHAPRAGGETILSKLSELMFLHAVRQHIDSLPEESTGWLAAGARGMRSEEHTSELQSLMCISYAVFCLKKTNTSDNSRR